MGGWDTNWNRDVLERIVVLLFALAELADRAAGASYFRRRQVLGILSHGEAEARAFVFGTAGDAPGDALERAGDAAGLAARLRVLALALCVMLAQAALSRPGDVLAGRATRGTIGPAVRGVEVSSPDTS